MLYYFIGYDIMKLSPVGGKIFLNNLVLGISWLISVDMSHKILPTLYILRGKRVDRVSKKKGGHETENSCSWFN